MAERARTRLVFMAFNEEMIGRTVLEELRSGIKRHDVAVEDWALLHKSPDGRLSIMTDRSLDPGPVEGAVFGGIAGLVLGIVAGFVGAGAVLGAAALGGLTAALVDSGMPDHEIRQVGRLMAAGGTGLMMAVPHDEVGRFDAFVQGNTVFEAATDRHDVDIVPGRTLEQALEEHRSRAAR